MTDPRRETLERLRQALNAGDDGAVVSCMTADVVLDWSRSIAPYAGVMHGHEDALRFLPTLFDPFGEMRQEYTQVDLLDDGRALAGVSMIAKGRGSGLEIEARGVFLIEFEGRAIARMTVFQSAPEVKHHLNSEKLAGAHLYFVCEGRPGDGDPEPLLDAAFSGGVDVIQLREKAPRCTEEMVALAEPFRRAAEAHGALFFVNDDPKLVGPCGADGVHLGQDDAAVADARRSAGASALVGLSTHSPEQFDAAIGANGGARPDQISAGPVWQTPTKPGRAATGLGLIEHAAAHGGDAPWFAIGGIDSSTVGQVAAAGARRAVVVRAIRDAADPEAAARELRSALAAGGAHG